MQPVILLTGQPGVGKTTAIKSIISLLGPRAGGFYTREVRARGQRTGFELVTLDGRIVWLASRSPAKIFEEEVPFGKYRVNLRAIESFGIPALRRAVKAGQVVVIDEIGPMEIVSELFCQTVLEILATDLPVLGTIVQRSHPFADQIRAHPRVQIRLVTLANREQIPPQVAAALTAT